MWEYIHARALRASDIAHVFVIGAWAMFAVVIYIVQPADGAWWVFILWSAAVLNLYAARPLHHRYESQMEKVKKRYTEDSSWADEMWRKRIDPNGPDTTEARTFGAHAGVDDPESPYSPLGSNRNNDAVFAMWLNRVAWPTGPATNPVAVQRLPVPQIFCLLSLTVLALYGTRDLLAHSRLGIGPDQAPAVIATAVGLPGVIMAVIMIIPRALRAWGAGSKDAGSGQAERVRAQMEGEAAIIRAKAELRRANAEYLRAQKGLPPLPAPTADGPPELPPPTSDSPDGMAPQA